MNSDIVISLFNNTIVLLGLSVGYSFFPYDYENKKVIRKIVVGVFVAIIGVVIMSNPFDFGNGVVFDTRSILISTTAMFFGLIPTIIGGVILIVYRLYLGGSGALTGTLVLMSSASIGLVWHYFRLNRVYRGTRKIPFYELLFGGFVVHVVMLLLMYTLPSTVRESIIQEIWWSVLFIYPIGSFFLNQFVLFQRNMFYQNIQTKASEIQFRSLFEQSRAILLLIHPLDGRIIDANQTAVEFYGWSLNELLDMKIMDINTRSEAEILEVMKDCLETNQSNYQFQHQRANGLIADVEVHSSPIEINDELFLFSTIVDITDKMKMEQEMSKKQDEIAYISFHDHLTGLYNRYYMEDVLEKLEAEDDFPYSVIMGDVNGLKLVNDTFSHPEGDRLLIEIGRILSRAVRNDDVVARWGGDEFMILLRGTGATVAEKIIQRIKKLCKESDFDLIEPSISIGSCTKTTADEHINDLLKLAEERMYLEKEQETNVVRNNIVSSILTTLYEQKILSKKESEQIQELATQLAKQLGLSTQQIESVQALARYQDLGYIGINKDILRKTTTLSPSDCEIIKTHATIGWRIISNIPDLQFISEEVHYHHEHVDGSGYPKQLMGEDIPILSRVILIVDAYVAMTSGRPYKKAISHEDAIQELVDCKGTHFDSTIVDAFVAMFK